MKKVFGVLLIGLLSACASQTPQPSAEVEEKSVGAQPAARSTSRTTTEGGPTLNPLTDPNNILSKRSVYFDFDSYVVKDELQIARSGARPLPAQQSERQGTYARQY